LLTPPVSILSPSHVYIHPSPCPVSTPSPFLRSPPPPFLPTSPLRSSPPYFLPPLSPFSHPPPPTTLFFSSFFLPPLDPFYSRFCFADIKWFFQVSFQGSHRYFQLSIGWILCPSPRAHHPICFPLPTLFPRLLISVPTSCHGLFLSFLFRFPSCRMRSLETLPTKHYRLQIRNGEGEHRLPFLRQGIISMTQKAV